MKEIKFRAWDKEERRMLNVLSIHFCEEYIDTNKHFRNFEDIELMQFIGIKDKDGVEIYEGDIVEDSDGFLSKVSIGVRRHENIEILSYNISGFWNLNDKLGYALKTEYKVVGNKYDNPELLKSEKFYNPKL